MNYIEEAIDSQCEYGRKYLELVSGCDYGDNLEVHHIVPVAYFSDVLGIKECRTSRSPDMARENLVSLSLEGQACTCTLLPGKMCQALHNGADAQRVLPDIPDYRLFQGYRGGSDFPDG